MDNSTLSATESAPPQENNAFDDFSPLGCHPSDEWGDKKNTSVKNEEETISEQQLQPELSENMSQGRAEQLVDSDSNLSKNFFSDYLSRITQGKFANSCSSVTGGRADA
ncbi:MAG: hypothetical protein SGILL_003047, partial [Bacillariaceae sp.]